MTHGNHQHPTHPARTYSRRQALTFGGGVAAAVALSSLPVFRPVTAAAASLPTADLVPDDRAILLTYPEPGGTATPLTDNLPIGNGRIGALTNADPGLDGFILTDSTLWTGDANLALDGDGQFSYETTHFGTVSMLGKLTLSIPAHTGKAATGYERRLDLSNGITTSSYTVGGVRYRRAVYASHPDDVIVIALSQDGGGTLTGKLTLTGEHGETTSAGGHDARFSGSLGNGLAYGCVVTATAAKGTVRAANGVVTFADCTDLLVVVSGGTNYTPDPSIGFQDKAIDPLDVATGRAHSAAAHGAKLLLGRHLADYQSLFGGLDVDLGTSTPAQRAMSTPERLAARASTGAPDPELEASYLQFGRYLTIAGSRSMLPINLQGLWIDRNNPDWMSDYHTDINLQMCYWLADRAGLSSCFDPLADYLLAQLPGWTTATQKLFNDPRNGFRNTSGKVDGWTLAISTNVYGGNGWWWHPAGNAWLCNSVFEHYEFTQDTAYLAKIYPLLKGACDFWKARLITTTVTDPATGKSREVLVDDHDWSPEQGPTDARGITYAQELVWQLFTNLRTAADVLHRDQGYAATIDELRSRLYLPQVSPTSGKLEEWMSPDDLGDPQHRHLSPLIGLFPGDRLAPDVAPSYLVDGARRLLEARGMSTYGWGMAWRGLCWARLKDPAKAYQAVMTVLRPSVNNSNGAAANFFDMYSFGSRSTFQIDANLGTPSAMLEMLVYSRPDLIELLPATPTAWSDGSVRGIGARGGFTVDVAWSGRQVTSATVHSHSGGKTTVRFGDWSKAINVPAGGSVSVRPPAKTWPPEQTDTRYLLVNRGSGLALSPSSPSQGAPLVQQPRGADNTTWFLAEIAAGICLITAPSGLVADVSGGGTASGTSIIQWSASGSTNQQWRIENTGDYTKFVNVRSGLLLSVAGDSTAAGAAIEQLADTGDATQQWSLVAVS
ncbi:glycosyl hydrolase family 95 catalytic domain-containing protein [Flexivirga alba]|uniref:Glycoside hydrolase N-terminal domain-containing protein n=1 Tax=Flexivirga alba TaxID=702742 RepID=A0ABW2ABE8_9MICO